MKYTVLVVDDNIVNRILIINILKRYIGNINFLEAQDGNEALDILDQYDVDLVILDLIMPKKDGYEVLTEMKALEKLKDIPVIINSSDDDIESIKKMLLQGATDYFLKPLKQDEMDVILPIKIKNALKYYEQQKIIGNINEVNRQELEMASTLQISLMAKYKNFNNLQMFGKYLPCFKVGGDLYDCLEYDDSTWFFIADVAGHGVAAAMVSSMLKGLFNDAITKCNSSGEVLQHINKLFCNILGDDNKILVTGAVGQIKNGILNYSNAGHPYPLLVNTANNDCQFLKQNGFLLGVFDDSVFETKQYELTSDSILLTYTDGIFKDGYGSNKDIWENLINFTLSNINILSKKPEQYLDKLVTDFTGSFKSILEDDITIMVLKLK